MLDKIITNALYVSKDNLNETTIKEIINNLELAFNNNIEALKKASTIDNKNNNGFIIDFAIIKNIFNNIKKENILYKTIILEQKDESKKIIYGKELLDYGIVAVFTDGNPYIGIDLILRNILAGNTTILVNEGYMYGTNNLIIKIVKTALSLSNIPENLIQMHITEDYDQVLSNYANIDLVVCIGKRTLQNNILAKSKVKTICSGYENFDIYIEDDKHKEFIDKIIETNQDINIYINKEITLDYQNAMLVESIDEAIAQINYNGNRYSAAIFTSDSENASKFIKEVKAKIVTVNTSPTIERIIDIKQTDLMLEKTIIYPSTYKTTNELIKVSIKEEE